MNTHISRFNAWLTSFSARWFVPTARLAFFIIFFYFGILKVLGLSPASPLAEALAAHTIGSAYFDLAFMALAVLECIIGVLFLIPRATSSAVVLLLIHMVIVCSPLVLVPEHAWSAPFVPSLEGQYIIKNAALVALGLGLVTHSAPTAKKKHTR